jgi:hypothetical protein
MPCRTRQSGYKPWNPEAPSTLASESLATEGGDRIYLFCMLLRVLFPLQFFYLFRVHHNDFDSAEYPLRALWALRVWALRVWASPIGTPNH